MNDAAHILQRVHETIRLRDPSVLARGERWRPGGIFDLNEHMLRLSERVQRADRKHTMTPTRLCDGCFYLTPTGFCPHRGRCVLHTHSDAVLRAVSAAQRG